MCRLLILFISFFFLGTVSYCQEKSTSSAELDVLRIYNQEMYGFNKKAWLTIGGASLAGAAVSIPGIIMSEDLATKSFHQMSVIYYGLNLAFAFPGYFSARKSYRSSYSIKETYTNQIRQEKTYLFNTGLDVFYTASGFFIKEIGKNYPEKQEIFNGVGNALIVQSIFLFAVDMSMSLIHSSHRKNKFDTKVEWGITPNGFGLKLKLWLSN